MNDDDSDHDDYDNDDDDDHDSNNNDSENNANKRLCRYIEFMLVRWRDTKKCHVLYVSYSLCDCQPM